MAGYADWRAWGKTRRQPSTLSSPMCPSPPHHAKTLLDMFVPLCKTQICSLQSVASHTTTHTHPLPSVAKPNQNTPVLGQKIQDPLHLKKNHDSCWKRNSYYPQETVCDREEWRKNKDQRRGEGEIKNVLESREVKKKKPERSGEKRSRGKLRRDREETEKNQRDGSENQGRGEKGKHRARQRTREKGVGMKAIPCVSAYGYACAQTLWWMGLFVLCSPARILGAAVLTAVPLHWALSQG